jgi:hypothetical protein
VREEREQEGDKHQHHLDQDQQEGDQLQHHQPDLDETVGEEIEAVTTACINRMPGSILQASQGGPCPRTIKLNSVINIITIEVDRGQGQEGCQDDHQAEQLGGGQDDHHPGQRE